MKKKNLQKKKFLFLALLTVVFGTFGVCAARASTFVTYPESWDIGQAFVVALS
jgi:hypothetical protein